MLQRSFAKNFKQASNLAYLNRFNHFRFLQKRSFCAGNDATNTKSTSPTAKNYHFQIITDVGEKPFRIGNDKTLEDFEKEFKTVYSFNSLEFRRWDYSFLPKSNNIAEVLSDITYIRVNKMDWQILQRERPATSSEGFQALDSVGLGFNQEMSCEKHLVADNIMEIYKKLQNMNTEGLHNKEIYNMALQLYSIQTHNYNEANNKLINDKEQGKAFANLMDKYYSLKKEYANLLFQEEKLLSSANKKAKFLIFLGGFLFTFQLGLLYYGTFVLYSWDITEPITYLVGCSNLFLACVLKSKFKQKSPFEFFRFKFFQRTNFFKKDYPRLLSLKDEIAALEKKLN